MTTIKSQSRSPLFHLDFASGVHNLDTIMDVDGSKVEPTFIYLGGMATANTWLPYKYGDTLSIVRTGDAPTLNDGSPLLGPLDDSVRGNFGKNYQRVGDNDYANLSGDDVWVKVICTYADETTRIFSKQSGAAWFELQQNPSSQLRMAFGPPSNVLIVPGLLEGEWYVLDFVFDRSGSARAYKNGLPVDTEDITSVVELDTPGSFNVLGWQHSVNTTTGSLAYLALWQKAGWFD